MHGHLMSHSHEAVASGAKHTNHFFLIIKLQSFNSNQTADHMMMTTQFFCRRNSSKATIFRESDPHYFGFPCLHTLFSSECQKRLFVISTFHFLWSTSKLPAQRVIYSTIVHSFYEVWKSNEAPVSIQMADSKISFPTAFICSHVLLPTIDKHSSSLSVSAPDEKSCMPLSWLFCRTSVIVMWI